MVHFTQTYGAWLVGILIMIECSGIPIPGETSLIASAIYAGTAHGPSIWIIASAAIAGASAGNVTGFLVGRLFGYRLLIRYGAYIRLPESRLKIGEYLFRHYGIAAIAVARFVPLLRSIMPLLAGANRMLFRPFLIASVSSAVAWVTIDALASFYFGQEIMHLSTAAMIGAVLLVVIVFTGITVLIGRNEQKWLLKAEMEFPGDLPRQ